MSPQNGDQLPEGWMEVPIEEILYPLDDGRVLHQGWSPQCEKIPAPTDADWGVLRTTAIQPGAFLSKHNKKLPTQLAPRSHIEVKSGDLLITCAGPRSRCGVACLVRNTRPRLMMSGKMYRFRVSPDLFDARFLEAFLLTPKAVAAIDKMKTGGSDSGLNLTHDRFLPLPVPVAPLNEQRRIMDATDELLSDLDAAVAALQSVRGKLQLYRATVLKAAVEGSLTAVWRKQHPDTEPASELLKRILAERRNRWEGTQLQKFKHADKEPPKNWKAKYQNPIPPESTNLAHLPDGWCWVSVDQVGETQGGLQKSPARIPTNKHYPYLRVANVLRGYLNLDEVHRFELNESELKRLRLEVGDLLIVEGNGSRTEIGRSALWRGEIPDCIHQNHIIRVRPLSGINPDYMDQFFNSPIGQRAIQLVASSTSGLYTLSVGKIERLPVAMPPTEEQNAIVELIEDHLSVIDHLEGDIDTKIASAQGLRQSILRSAFEGQLVRQEPNDEPASELLKRIAAAREELAKPIKTKTTKAKRSPSATSLQ